MNSSDLADYHWTVTTLVLQQEIDIDVDVSVVCPSSPSLVSHVLFYTSVPSLFSMNYEKLQQTLIYRHGMICT